MGKAILRAAIFRERRVWKILLVRTGRKSVKFRSCTAALNVTYSECHRSAVTRRSLVSEFLVQSQIIPCGIYGKLSGNRKGFSESSSELPVSIGQPILHCHLLCT
jgi:hypothetical protein